MFKTLATAAIVSASEFSCNSNWDTWMGRHFQMFVDSSRDPKDHCTSVRIATDGIKTFCKKTGVAEWKYDTEGLSIWRTDVNKSKGPFNCKRHQSAAIITCDGGMAKVEKPCKKSTAC
jgi:hypothetical protein